LTAETEESLRRFHTVCSVARVGLVQNNFLRPFIFEFAVGIHTAEIPVTRVLKRNSNSFIDSNTQSSTQAQVLE